MNLRHVVPPRLEPSWPPPSAAAHFCGRELIGAAALLGGSAANAADNSAKAKASIDVAQESTDISAQRRYHRHYGHRHHGSYAYYAPRRAYYAPPAYYAQPYGYGYGYGGPVVSLGFGGGGFGFGGHHHHHRGW